MDDNIDDNMDDTYSSLSALAQLQRGIEEQNQAEGSIQNETSSQRNQAESSTQRFSQNENASELILPTLESITPISNTASDRTNRMNRDPERQLSRKSLNIKKPRKMKEIQISDPQINTQLLTTTSRQDILSNRSNVSNQRRISNQSNVSSQRRMSNQSNISIPSNISYNSNVSNIGNVSSPMSNQWDVSSQSNTSNLDEIMTNQTSQWPESNQNLSQWENSQDIQTQIENPNTDNLSDSSDEDRMDILNPIPSVPLVDENTNQTTNQRVSDFIPFSSYISKNPSLISSSVPPNLTQPSTSIESVSSNLNSTSSRRNSRLIVDNDDDNVENISQEKLNTFLNQILERKKELCPIRRDYVNFDRVNSELDEILNVNPKLAERINHIIQYGDKQSIVNMYKILTTPSIIDNLNDNIKELMFRSIEGITENIDDINRGRVIIKPHLRSSSLSEELEKLSNENDRLISEKMIQLQELSELKKLHSNEVNRLKQLNLDYHSAYNNYIEADTKLRSTEIELNRLTREKREIEDNNRVLHTQQIQLKDDIRRLEEELDLVRNSTVEKLNSELVETKRELISVKNKYDQLLNEQNTDELIATIQDKENQIADLQDKVDRLNIEIEKFDINQQVNVKLLHDSQNLLKGRDNEIQLRDKEIQLRDQNIKLREQEIQRREQIIKDLESKYSKERDLRILHEQELARNRAIISRSLPQSQSQTLQTTQQTQIQPPIEPQIQTQNVDQPIEDMDTDGAKIGESNVQLQPQSTILQTNQSQLQSEQIPPLLQQNGYEIRQELGPQNQMDLETQNINNERIKRLNLRTLPVEMMQDGKKIIHSGGVAFVESPPLNVQTGQSPPTASITDTIATLQQNLHLLNNNMANMKSIFTTINDKLIEIINTNMNQVNSGKIDPHQINKLNALVRRKRTLDNDIQNGTMYYSSIIQDLMLITNEYIQTYELFNMEDAELKSRVDETSNSFDNIVQITKKYTRVTTLKRKISKIQRELNDLISKHNYFISSLTYGVLFVSESKSVSLLLPNTENEFQLDMTKLKAIINANFRENNLPTINTNVLSITPLTNIKFQ